MTKEALDKLKALCDAATPGPWFKQGTQVRFLYKTLPKMSTTLCEVYYPENCEFIAAARTALPQLIETLEAYQVERIQLLLLLKEIVAVGTPERVLRRIDVILGKKK